MGKSRELGPLGEVEAGGSAREQSKATRRIGWACATLAAVILTLGATSARAQDVAAEKTEAAP